MTLSPQLVTATIQDDKDLAKAVQDLVTTYPDTAGVMTRLLTYFQIKQSGSPSKPVQGIAQYFNRTPSEATTTGSNISTAVATAPAKLNTTIEDIGPAIYSTSPQSFLHPIRKKLVLSFHQRDLALISAANNTNNTEIICSAPYESLYRVIAVPFLERTTKQTALILFFKHSGISTGSSKDAVWAVPLADDGKDFTLEFHKQHQQLVGLEDDLRSMSADSSVVATNKKKQTPPIPFITGSKRPDPIIISILSYFLHRSNPTNYNSSAIDIIASRTQAYPNFSAHLKSNQGTMYLLPTGILFAFRKPILFMRSAVIEAIGFHSVTSRTFDMEIVMDNTSGNATTEDLEGVPQETKGDNRRVVGFSMIDTKEFGQVEEWIKKAGIRDRSLSADLKAKDKGPTTASSSASSKKRERAADDDDLMSESASQSSQQSEANTKKKQRGIAAGAGAGAAAGATISANPLDDDDDDEDDEDFAPESEDEIMEEYDSDAEGSDSDNENGEDVSTTNKKKSKKQQVVEEDDEEDLEEESLGEDTDEDEDEDEDEDDDGGGDGDEEEEDVDGGGNDNDHDGQEEEDEDELEEEDEDIEAPSRHRNDDEEEVDELDED
ncbi:hypothetical protein BX616_000342 [Lobosporangium transversale]|uniref:Histone chaperone Rttp106-like-domain-containing protein n=1 Tax=Lobosporangium transversale TaxID=64571 RepID=A0A1Y2GNW4_9FUNG|nr:histone chaperone Rttp106-like-domain-containing protein [Lobosporangium transversale]KAF9907741.1 hypothetical protein BX616_000342 [Lobosporangium transversale]ORZ17409.1 histone chaperone Rttp106-like-domain-containing protein [Lobosporangium transversale]|eukprot:XP_021881796.1 histone chaperone Rttp106-like-domain-containing protein [Lobosporangium transversale]